MRDATHQGRRFILLLGCVGLFGLVCFWWLCAHSPRIAFLTTRGPAEWIVYPKPSDRRVYQTMELSAEFRRSFVLSQPPGSAVLTLRALKHYLLTINGTPVEIASAPPANWKQSTEFDISKLLRAGTNDISVAVFNSNGPPALWLTLNAGTVTLNTDRDWDVSLAGAVWRPARPVSQPEEIGPGNEIYGGENTISSLCRNIPVLLLFAALSAAIVWTCAWWLKKYQTSSGLFGQIYSSRFAVMAMLAAALRWAALFFNNIHLLPNTVGFDAETHLDYVNYIIKHRALPLATDGWEMCQAPLYYIISALVVSPLHSSVTSDVAVRWLRILGLLVGLVQVGLVFLSLRLLFPKQIGKQLFGLVLVACLPELLYISQYISNESMAAMWTTASIYFCLRLLKEDRGSWQLSAATGLCLGAALLTKVTALLAIPFIGGALAGWLWLKRSKEVGAWLRTLGVVMLTCFAVCGWHYLRVWRHFGSPIVNDWDPASGFAWWTDDGYHTAAYFSSFGASLIHPFYSVFHGFFDGIYSTLWGDGLYGGMTALRTRPPWNYGLMASGFLLALLPTAVILTGIAACVRRFVRQPEPAWFLLLGLPATTLAALIYMNLKLPFYCNVKAFYGMMALVPMCSFGAIGWGVLMERIRAFRPILCVAFGVWALTAYASFWIRGDRPFTHVTRGVALAGDDSRRDDAINEFSEALRLDPHDGDAKVSLAVELSTRGQSDEAIRLLNEELAEHPDDANGHLQLASILAAQGKLAHAIFHGQRAIALGPDYAKPYHHVCAWLSQLGNNQEALAVGREGLRLNPTDPELHFMVACALASATNHLEAVRHFRLACNLRPDWAVAHDDMGMSLAMLGHWDDAIGQFDKAAGLKPGIAVFHDHLAAAYAETGHFIEAAAAAAKAIELAQKTGDATLAAQSQKRLEFCRAKLSELQSPPPSGTKSP